MRCSSVLPKLDALACDDLPPGVSAPLAAHVAACFSCTRAYAEAVEARNALGSLHLGAPRFDLAGGEFGAAGGSGADAMGIPGVDESFFRVMREEILAEVASVPLLAAPRPRRRFWFGSGFAAAAALLFAVGFLLSAPQTGRIWPYAPFSKDGDGVLSHTTNTGGSEQMPVSAEGGLRPADETAIPVFPMPIFIPMRFPPGSGRATDETPGARSVDDPNPPHSAIR